MKKCVTIEDGVRAVLDVYRHTPTVEWELIPAAEGELVDHILLDGEKYPLFWWRFDTQVAELCALAPERKLCSMKLNRSCSKADGLERLMYKEFDIAENVFRSKIEKVMCFKNENALNMLATMKNERVAVFELSAALNENTPEQGRHIYWGQDGMASDRVVSQKVASEAIYLFTEDEEKPAVYNDIFIYMYGLNKTDATKAEAIAEILMGRIDISDWHQRDAHYRSCIAAAEESARAVKRVTVKEEV